MGPESPRITELRRRVESDPSSIAFAQLAEEYRRAGDYEAAERYCRSGLTRHPAYLSARVTLGRTLIELNKLDDAEQELKQVLVAAPDNLAALRGVAEIHQRLGKLDAALEYYRRALTLSRHDPDLEELVERLSRTTTSPPPSSQPATESHLDFDELLESLGIADRAAPPIVEALLDQSSVPGPQRSVDEQSPVLDRPSLLDGQSSFVGPEPMLITPEDANAEPDWMTGPLPEISAPLAEELSAESESLFNPLASFDQEEPSRSNDQSLRGDAAGEREFVGSLAALRAEVLETPEIPNAPDALVGPPSSASFGETSAFAPAEPWASFAESWPAFVHAELPAGLDDTASALADTGAEPVRPAATHVHSPVTGTPPGFPHRESSASDSGTPWKGGEAGNAPASPESALDAKDTMILDELEAWLKAIQR